MHKQNNQHLYYFTSIQNTSIPMHIPQHHTSHHFTHRIDPIGIPPLQKNQYAPEPKINYSSPNENDLMILRKDHRNNCFHNDGQTTRYMYNEYQNSQVPSLAGSRAGVGANLENIRNQSVIHIKRKQSVNLTSRQVREQYYKGHQMEELMNKLPQIDLQPLNRVQAPRPTHTSPPPQLKTARQMKKAVSPFHVQNRSLSFKENNLQASLLRKFESQENSESKRPKQWIRFNSPVRNSPYSSYQSPEKQCLNPERNYQNKSGCSTRRQSNADTSNSCSTLFDPQPKFLQSIPSPRLMNPTKPKLPTELPECQVNISQQYVRHQIEQSQEYEQNDMGKSRQRQRQWQEDLQKEKLNNLQNQAKIKNLQSQLMKIKQQTQKTILDLKAEWDERKQSEFNEIRSEYEKKINHITEEARILEDKLSQEQKDARVKSAKEEIVRKQLDKVLKQVLDEKNRLLLLSQQKQQKLRALLLMIQGLQETNRTLEEKIASQQDEAMRQQGKITELTAKLQPQNPMIKLPNSQLLEQNKNLEQKMSTFLVNMDKQVIKFKQCKTQLEKAYRRIEELNIVVYEKDNNIKNMLKQLRNRDKFISELKKNFDVMNLLVKQSGQDIVKLQLKAKNQKYKQIQENETENSGDQSLYGI